MNPYINNITFKNNEFHSKVLEAITFDNCVFDNVIFRECRMEAATFDNCTFMNCRFIKCNLTRSQFFNCTASKLWYARSILTNSKMQYFNELSPIGVDYCKDLKIILQDRNWSMLLIGDKISMGCRFFTIEKAISHWKNKENYLTKIRGSLNVSMAR